MREVKPLARAVGKVTVRGAGRVVGIVGKKAIAEAEAEKKRDLEAEVAKQLRDSARNLNESMQDVHKRLALESESDYWCGLVFQTHQQRQEFLTQLRDYLKRTRGSVPPEVDESDFIDGRALARAFGFKLSPSPEWKESKVKGTFAALAAQPPPVVKPSGQ